MSFYNREKIQSFYQVSTGAHELHLPQAVGWFNENTQKVRFFVLSQIADLSDKSVLDVGCGAGAFYPYLDENFADFQFTGIDLSQEFIEYNRRQFPQGTWHHADFLDHDFGTQRFDFVCSSGAMAVKVEDNTRFVQTMISKMFELAKTGVAVNMLSDRAPDQVDAEHLSYYSPTAIFDFCKRLTPFVTLRHDYLKNDFTVYLFRE